MFFVYTPKREAVVFKFLRVDERSRKAAFSWRISVDGRPICRNKVAFSDSSHGEWKGTKFQLESYPIYRYCKAQKLSRQMINDSFICPFLNLPSKCSLRHKLSWLWSLLCVLNVAKFRRAAKRFLPSVNWSVWKSRPTSSVLLMWCTTNGWQ